MDFTTAELDLLLDSVAYKLDMAVLSDDINGLEALYARLRTEMDAREPEAEEIARDEADYAELQRSPRD